MLVKVTVNNIGISVDTDADDFKFIADNKEAPPTGTRPLPSPPTPLTRLKVFCNLCNRGGCISSYFGDYTTVCPACRGKKFLTIIKNPYPRLAAALGYARDFGLTRPSIHIAFAVSLLLAMSLSAVFERFNALLSYFF